MKTYAHKNKVIHCGIEEGRETWSLRSKEKVQTHITSGNKGFSLVRLVFFVHPYW